MSSPRTGILSLNRFNYDKVYDRVDSMINDQGLEVGTALGLGLGLGLRGPDLGIWLDNIP